jgi:hypothetical protein
MEAGVAGFEVRRTIILIVMRCGSVVFVRGEPVVMLRMVVVGVCVDVQRRDLPGCRGHNQSEQSSCEAIHHDECM